MRITRVKKSRKHQGNCGRCGDELPVGSAYRWIKFRRGPKRKRCTKNTCRFRQSDMVISDKKADIFLAQENAEDAIRDVRVILTEGVEPASLDEALTSLSGTITESSDEATNVSEGYEESAQNQEQYFEGSYKIDEMREQSSSCQEWADQLVEAASKADELAESVSGEEWSIEDIESGLDEIDDFVNSLELMY